VPAAAEGPDINAIFGYVAIVVEYVVHYDSLVEFSVQELDIFDPHGFVAELELRETFSVQ